MEFTTITRRVAELYDVELGQIQADPEFVGPGGWRGRNGETTERAADAPSPSVAPRLKTRRRKRLKCSPTRARSKRSRRPSTEANMRRSSRSSGSTSGSPTRFAAGVVALDTETTSLDAMNCDLVGVSLALAPDRACYIPLGHLAPGAQDLFGGAGLAPGQIPLAAAMERLKPLLEDAATLKIAHNMKYDLQVLSRHGVNVAPLEDTMLISYALDTGRNNHGLDELALKHLGHKNICLWRGRRHGAQFHRFRARRAGQGDRIRRRGRGRLFAPVARVEAAPRRRAHDDCLRDAGASDGRDARRDGAARGRHRSDDSRRVSPGNSRRRWRDWRGRFTRPPASASIWDRPSSSAIFCSARWDFPAPRKPRPAPGRPRPACSTSWPKAAMVSRRSFSNGASSPS